MNPLRGSCVLERSRCGAVRIFYVADKPSAGIVRVGSLSLRRRANFKAGQRTLCGDRACWSALAVAPCELSTWPTNPLRGSCVSELAVAPCELSTCLTNPLRGLCVSDRSRCGAMRISKLAEEPSAGIVRRNALAVAPCKLSTSPTNPLWGSCVSERSRCGAMRIFYVADAPSAGIVRVGALLLWRRANFLRGRRSLCGDRACWIALAVAPCEFARWPTNPLRGSRASDRSRCGAVRICTLADEPPARIAHVGSLSLWF